jgi:SAM-dependent methyltransferase
MGKKTRKATKKKRRLTAATADRHRLYEKTVQNPEFELDLLDRCYRLRVGRAPRSMREDFCGTALLSREWVRGSEDRAALGVDLDRKTLAWAREHNLEPYADELGDRMILREGDVRTRGDDRHDILCALNFSYMCFKTRDALRHYFEVARHHLAEDGVFVMDLFGGWEAQQVIEEERKYRGYRYVWEQSVYNPIDASIKAHIHFRFPDKTELRRAFSYDWRLWTLVELQELLREAGFAHVDVLWEDEDEDGEGTGVYRPRRKARNDPGFISYLVASERVPPRRRKAKAKKRKKEEKG